MNKLLDTTQAVGEVPVAGTLHEVCAEAQGEHHASGELVVDLRCFLRAKDPNHIGESAHPAWLPADERVREQVDADEAHDLTRDIFASWCRKVQRAIPANATRP